MVTYSWIPKYRPNFLAMISSGFSEPVSNFFNKFTFSFICAPNCSRVSPFLVRASLINLAKSGLKTMLSEICMLPFILPGLIMGLGLGVAPLLLTRPADGKALGGEYGLPCFEQALQTLSTKPSTIVLFFSSVSLRPHNSQNVGMISYMQSTNLAFSQLLLNSHIQYNLSYIACILCNPSNIFCNNLDPINFIDVFKFACHTYNSLLQIINAARFFDC